ncbi:ABC transporter [Microbacterium sp. 1.5R]|uniref:ABC transporter n=1 Tax=Microbacterium sp. 1.5R TaxID=1916917 RepID=UPI001642FC7E|nr:ABC transporter [Microbacterium sp. 1.5R]
MTPPLLRRDGALAALALAVAFSLVACAGAPGPDPSPAPSSASTALPSNDGVDGGGAAEVASPASALVIADDDGGLTLLDLETEQRADLDGDGTVTGSGRFVHRIREAGGETAVEVVDSGRWTVPHGDHSHSFRGETRVVGTIEGDGPATATVGDQATAVRFDGGVVVLDHETLDVDDAPRLALPGAGPVIPFAAHLISVSGSAVDVLDAAGAPTGITVPCTEPSDADITRVGAVIACAEGAVLVTREIGGQLAAESIPYPAGLTPPVQLAGRADRPDLAGIAGDQGALLLDTRARTWTLLPADAPLVTATAIGDDDSRTVVVALDGTVRVLGEDGAERSRTEPLLAASASDPVARARITVLVDARHAYVSDPASGAVHEIDHRDGTVTRTFDDLEPRYVQLVG